MIKNSTAKKSVAKVISGPKEKIIQGLFIIADHWQSDLKFFEDELRFLTSLMNKFLPQSIAKKNIKSTSVLTTKLVALEKIRTRLDKNVANYLSHLTDLIKSQYTNKYSYENEHSKLEVMLTAFLKDFRQVKKEIFNVTEQSIKNGNTVTT